MAYDLLFWQGIISIHQKTFLEALAKQPTVGKVTLVVEQDITPYRKSMGWDVPQIEGIAVIVAPSIEKVKKIVAENKNATHIFGGIRVGKMLTAAFEACIKHKCRLGIMSEPYNAAGIKGMLRTIKYHFYRSRYSKHIQFILAIGKQGIMQYNLLGYPSAKIYPWAYFINISPTENTAGAGAPRRIIYAGRLEEAKGIYRFVEELTKTGSGNYIFDLYGEGPDEQKIKQLITDKNLTGQIRVHPFLKHGELVTKYASYDWVVLPSAGKDGWGVIISEGLLHGLKAICSSMAGVSLVIKGNFNGLVFDWDKPGSCADAINEMLVSSAFADGRTIGAWAQQTISADAGAVYFTQILGSIYNNKPKPPAPWDAYKETNG
jgi:glycosyltransferase involved in cell wall biosynthesis